MPNQLNSGKLDTLKTGQTLLTKVIKTSTNKVQIELAERVNNPNATTTDDGFSNALGMMNSSDSRFTAAGKPRRHWAAAEPFDIETMLGVEGLDLENGIYTLNEVTGKEEMVLNILNPVACVDPSTGEEIKKRFRIRIIETTEGSDYDVANGRFKTRGKGGDPILHNGNYIYNKNQVVFADDLSEDVKVPHVFLASDTVSVQSKVEATKEEQIVEEMDLDMI